MPILSATSSPSRRKFLLRSVQLSAAGTALLAGITPKAFASDVPPSTSPQDIDVLNGILGTEHEGIGVYQIFHDRGLVPKDTLALTTLFQGHHKEHRDYLMATIQKLGGKPVMAKSNNAYAEDLDLAKIHDTSAALKLALKLERSAANAYIGMLPSTHDGELAKVAGRIAADEVMHWTSLTNALHENLPPSAMSFGA